MTRQRFDGLRRELVRRLCTIDGQKPNYRALMNCRPDMTKCGSYAGAWEMLKPARDCVGM